MCKRYDEIMDLCRLESNQAHDKTGSVKIRPLSLSQEGYDIRTFGYDGLRATCVGLSFTMLYKRMNMIIGDDHRILWDTIGKHLLDIPSLYFDESFNSPFPLEYRAFRELFVSVIKTATGEWSLSQIMKISDWKWFQMPAEYPYPCGVNPSVYLVYPLLEAVLKRTLSNYIDRDGTVKVQFTVSGRTYKSGKYCSRVDHMLILLGQQTHLSDLNYDLNLIYEHIAFLYPAQNPISVIAKKWRNPSVHGEDNFPTAYGILLNILLLIAMDYVKDDLKKKLSSLVIN